VTDAIDQLIDTRSRNVTPVHRLLPPLLRANLWHATVALVGGLIVAKFAERSQPKQSISGVRRRSSNIPLPEGTSLRRNPPHRFRFRRLARSFCHRMWM
jgi:hypothetical protein